MFKLESYITPWLLGYLDQYVKLRPEDLQLSLWGGDAVLYNLDLRLDVLQKAMHLPVVFKSGHIHELRLHVPWTKLGSEPMVITINTVECIVKVRDFSDASSSASSSSASKAASASSRRRKLKRQTTEDLPPGYLQSILNRVVNNVTFIVNNLILKFVEDDIVLSVNVKSAECYSCDGSWNRAFVDITPEDLALRRVVHFSDLTVCLDRSNTDGHIENYQEPMLYRCFMTCRLHMTYDSVHAKLPIHTKMNILCDKLHGLLSDAQLPMFLRLVELCLALYYGYLDVATDQQNEESVKASAAQDPSLSFADGEEREEEEEGEGEEDQGWAAWMWSMVPQILSEDEEEEGHRRSSLVDKSPVLSVGFYIQQASLTFKVTEVQREKGGARGHKVRVHPFLLLEVTGLAVEVLMQGMTFLTIQCGIQHISLATAGPCICGHSADASHQESQILRCGVGSVEGELAYDWGSLFDPSSPQNQGQAARHVVEREEHLRVYTEQYSQQRFPAFWVDYLSTLVLPPSSLNSGSQSSESDFGDGALFQQESSTCRFVCGPSSVQLTSSSVHRIHKLICCMWNYHYEPYRKHNERKDAGERVQLTEAQLAGLEECIPTCTYHVTLLQPRMVFMAASHPVCNVATKLYSTHISRRSKSKSPPAAEGSQEEMVELWGSAERFDLQVVSPMYPGRLVKLVSNIAGPSSNLMYHCHSHTQLKVFSLQAGLQRAAKKGVTLRPVLLLPPCSLAFYFRHLLLPHLWNNSHLSLWEHSYEIPQVTLAVSKASLLVAVQLLSSWTHPGCGRSTHRLSLVPDLFPCHGEDAKGLSSLELTVCGVELRVCHTALVQAYTGSLSSLQLLVHTPQRDEEAAVSVPVLYGPVDSSTVVNKTAFQHQPTSCLMEGAECVAFTLQTPHHTSTTEAPAILVVSMEGVAGCVDPALLQWFSYAPRKQPFRSPAAADPATVAAAVDMPLAKATSPLQPGSSQMSVRSGSSQTQPTTSRLFSHSHTPSHTQSFLGSAGLREEESHNAPAGSLDHLTKLLTSSFPLLRMMHVQVDVKSSCVFVPKTSVCVAEASGDIPANVRMAWQQGSVEEVLVMGVPMVSVHSVASTTMDVLQDIPITTLHGGLLSEKLPWTVEMSDWSVYTLHPGGASPSVIAGLGISSTVGATVQYNPPTSDIIQSLALCLHVDLQPLHISLSPSQIEVLSRLVEVLTDVGGATWQLAEHCTHQLVPKHYTTQPMSGGDTEQEGGGGVGGEQGSSHMQPETSLTGGTPDVGEALTTDVSDEVSHTSPLHTLLSTDLAGNAGVKLTVWLQCVLPRLSLGLFTVNSAEEVCVAVEDMALSCDIQQVYSKLKATVGNVNISRYGHSEAGDRVKDAACPVLFSTSRDLPQSVHVHSNKGWTSDRQSLPDRFPAQEPFTTSNMHGFFSLTLTRALCKSVRKKMRKMNVDVTSLLDREDSPAGDGLYFHQFVSEVCVRVEPVDVVIHFPTMKHALSLWQTWCGASPKVAPLHLARDNPSARPREASSLLVSSHTLPLLYVDVAALRLFIPVTETFSSSGDAQSSDPASTLSHDFLLVQWASLHVQPYADNPLPRYPVQRDLFHQALQCGMTQQTGSCVEDRQYQLTLHAMALSSGGWRDVVLATNERSSQVTPGVQIPALEWNNYLGHRPAVKELEVIPIVTAFDLCTVLAPPIVYTGMNKNQHVLVCGVTAELNVMSDLDLHVSTQQICLMTSTADLAMALSHKSASGSGDHHGRTSSSAGVDSGVASETSTATCPVQQELRVKDKQEKDTPHVPANVLLTAGRISLTIYTHTALDSNMTIRSAPSSSSTSSSSTQSSPHKQAAKKTASTDNFAALTRSMPAFGPQKEGEGDCVTFDFLQPRLDEGGEMTLTSGTVCVQPFVYVYIAQPHTVLSTWPQSDRLELSCYDILLKGVRQHHVFPVSEQRMMPDLSDFSMSWVETRAGLPDSKTGIPPCLLTLRVTGLLTPPADFDVKLERPVKVSVTQDMVQQVSSMVQHMMSAVQHPHQHPHQHHHDDSSTGDAGSGVGNTPTAAAACGGRLDSEGSDLPVWMTGVLDTVKRATLQTEQVMVSLDCVDGAAASSGLVTSLASIAMTVEQEQKKGVSPRVQGTMSWKDVVLKTVYNKTARLLAGPVTMETDMLMRWPTKGHTTPLQVVLGMQSGLLLLQLGEEHLMCLRHLVSVFHSNASNTAPPSGKQKRTGKSVPSEAAHLTCLNTSHDDLRSGLFVFIHNEQEGGRWPAPCQAVISGGEEEEGGTDSSLTWAYPELRCVTALSALPVPLGLLGDHASQLASRVTCHLQYWNECVEEFMTYATFELSGDSGTTVQLPQPRLVNLSSLVVAQVWRVLVCWSAAASPGAGSAELTATPMLKSRDGVLLAAQLAGSMCVDSAQVPQLVPSLQLSLAVGKIQLHLHNHLIYNGSSGCGKLRGYRLSAVSPQDQQWGVVTVDKVSIMSSHFTGPLSRSVVQVGSQVGVEVVDYSTLTLQSVVDPVDVSATTHLHHYQQPSAVKVEVSTSQLQVHVGRSVLHTINTSVMAWTQFGERKEEDGGLVLAHLVLCNNTQQTLRCGQAGTDENILLPSGHMFPYSWRSYTSKQHLHFCLDRGTWRWCTPIDVSAEGHCVRVVRARDQRYTLVVQVTQLSPIHKKVTVSGQFLVCSRLSQAVEVRFQLQDGEGGERECAWSMEGAQSAPSLVAEHEDMKGFSVRLAGHQLPWSHTLHLSGHAMHSNQLLKVLLPDGSSYFHVWCRIFCQNFSETRQKLIFLSPLYVLRSHLPLPLQARLFTPHSKLQQMLEVGGQGHEYQLHCTGGDVTHQLSFKLAPDMVESSPPLVLSSGLVDQVEQTAVAEVNIEAICQQQVPSLALDWPYNVLQSSSACEETPWSEVEQVGVDVNVQLSQYLPGCNTLLVNIAPWCLLTNLASLPLLLLTDTHHWKLPEGCTMAPSALKEFQVGCEREGQVWESSSIPLSEDEVEQHLYSPDLGRVLYLDGQVQIQLLLPSPKPGGLTQVVPLSVVSVIKHKIRVVTISERLRVSNVSGWTLQTQLMAVPQSSSKVRPSDFNIHPSPLPVSDREQRDGATALLDWQLLEQHPEGHHPLELVLYMTFRTTSHDAASQEEPGCWSTPVRIASSPQGSRNTVAMFREDGGVGGVSLCVTCVVEGALTYVVISRDYSPTCWIHNLCPFPLQYGQSLGKASLKGVVVQEEMELVEAVPMVPSRRWAQYTMPHVNATFPQVDAGPPPRLHVRPLLPADTESTGKEQQGPGEWSSGISLEPGDSFLHMSGMEHIKVHIQVMAMVHHITFTILSKAEVSAREVRSRIQGGQSVTRVEEGTSQPLPTSSATVSILVDREGDSGDTEAAVSSLAVCGEGWPSLTASLLLEGMVLTLHDDVSRPSALSQLMQVAADSLLLVCYPVGDSSSSLCVALCAGSVRVDNVLAHQGLYDFPVILQPQQIPSSLEVSLDPHKDVTEIHAMMRAVGVLHLQLVISKDRLLPAGWFLDSVELAVKPLSVFFEDTFFFRLCEECLCLLPHRLGKGESPDRRRCVPQDVWERAQLHQQPLQIRHMCVHPVSLLLSVHASVRLFLATDHAPLSLGRFERHNLFTGTQQLAYVLAMHYITAAIFRAGMVVGSMDLLGSPTGLVRSVSAGLTDLLRLPYQGLTRSPAAFVTGLLGGMSSLMCNVTAGIMTSVTNFASSVSRNMDRLSLDSGHLQRQEECRRQRPAGLSSGLQQGLTGFGLSLLGAVAGLVDQPLQTVLAQQSEERPSSATRRAGSIMAGVGKGLVGVITKPIGGAAELLSQTGQGFLQGTGLKQKVTPRHSIAEIQRLRLPTAWLKYPMKMLGESTLLLAVQGLQQDRGLGEGAEVVLLLTGDMVVVVGEEDDGQQQAFALSQLRCHSPAPAILVLTLTDTVFQVPTQMGNPNSRDRVAAFIKSAASESAQGAVWCGDRVPSPVAEENSSQRHSSADSTDAEGQETDSHGAAPSYHFRIDPHWSQVFVALFHIASSRQMGRGFSV